LIIIEIGGRGTKVVLLPMEESSAPVPLREELLRNVDLLLAEHHTQLHTTACLARIAERTVGSLKAKLLDSSRRQEGGTRCIKIIKIALEVAEEAAMVPENGQNADRCCHGGVTGNLNHLFFLVLDSLHILSNRQAVLRLLGGSDHTTVLRLTGVLPHGAYPRRNHRDPETVADAPQRSEGAGGAPLCRSAHDEVHALWEIVPLQNIAP
jgi:hypothetical protein